MVRQVRAIKIINKEKVWTDRVTVAKLLACHVEGPRRYGISEARDPEPYPA